MGIKYRQEMIGEIDTECNGRSLSNGSILATLEKKEKSEIDGVLSVDLGQCPSESGIA